MIFVSGQPVSVGMLVQLFPDLDRATLERYLVQLREEWLALDRGFVLQEVAGGYQFRTSPCYSDLIIRFKQSKPFRFSRAAMEVLAVVAYKQPVTRIDVEQIRGVDSSGVVNLLLGKNLIDICGRKDVIGKPFLYGTTQRFLETFGLKALDDLPSPKELQEIEKSMRRSLPAE